MNNLQHLLNTLHPITLDEMDAVRLMDRTDRKFVVHVSRIPLLLEAVKADYRVLEVEGKRSSRYKSLYFDTPAFDLFNYHHNGRLNRYKIRHREYVESNLGFLEVKFRNNKGRTIKTRVKQLQSHPPFTDKANQFLTAESPYRIEQLQPVLGVNYSRITLVGLASPERVTLDLDLEFVGTNKAIRPEQMAIVEVKQAGKAPSAMLDRLREMRIREGSLSKYCLGVSLTCPGLKINNFKPALHRLKPFL